MRMIVLALLLLPSAVLATTSTSDKNADFSSRCFAPYTKATMPDQEREDDESFVISLNPYFALGDPTVEGDPKCGDVAPTLSLDATTDANGCDISVADPSNPTLTCTLTDTALNGHTTTVTGDNSVGSSVTRQFDWTVTEAAGGDPVATPDGSVYLDCESGNDINDGSSHAQRVRSLARASALLGSTTSQDLYILAGSTCTGSSLPMLTINRDGTSGDPAVHGCYKVVGGQEQICESGDTKPILQGPFTSPDCDTADACSVPSINTGLVSIAGCSDYVRIKDLTIRDSYGRGIDLDGDSCGYTIGLGIEGVDVRHVGVQPIVLTKAREGYVKNSTSDESGLLFQYDYSVWDQSVRPSGLIITDSDNADFLIEGNTVTRAGGEAFNCLKSSQVVWRGNVAGKVFSSIYYMDNCSDSVGEGNIAYGGPHTSNGWGRNPGVNDGPSGALVVNNEILGGTRTSTGNLWRNNLVVGTAVCMTIASVSGRDVGAKFLGNTCLGTSNSAIGGGNQGPVVELELKNNIFYGDGMTDTTCPSITDADYNLWDGSPSDSDCAGANDVSGDPNTATIWSTLDDQDHTDPPAQADFEIVDATAADDVGVNLTATNCLDKTDYDSALSFMDTRSITEDQWEFCLYEDFSGEARDGGSAEDLGGLSNP